MAASDGWTKEGWYFSSGPSLGQGPRILALQKAECSSENQLLLTVAYVTV